MTDLALAYSPDHDAFDLCIGDGDLVLDGGLATHIVTSLFTDARAEAHEAEAGESDLRGWFGDALETTQPWGGKHWLLGRNKTLTEVLRKAEDYTHAALKWMIDDGIVARFDVAASRKDGEGSASVLTLTITAHRPTGEAVRYTYDLLWRAVA